MPTPFDLPEAQVSRTSHSQSRTRRRGQSLEPASQHKAPQRTQFRKVLALSSAGNRYLPLSVVLAHLNVDQESECGLQFLVEGQVPSFSQVSNSLGALAFPQL